MTGAPQGEDALVHARRQSHDTADALIVGAGPAGSVAALLLARRGLDVRLVDRAAFPRPKACGDCLSAAATGFLRRHGLLARLEATGPAWLDGWTLTSPGGRVCTGRFGAHRGLAIERRLLDAELRRAALEAGATPVVGQVVGLLRDPATGRVTGVRIREPDVAGAFAEGPTPRDTERRARLVIGADGLRSIVARRLGTVRRRPRLRKVSLTTHVRLRTDPASGDGAVPAAGRSLGRMHVLSGGCIGVAPVAAGRANVTLVVDERHAPRLREAGPAAFLREWLTRVPGLLDAIEPGFDEVLASGPFDWPSRRAAAAGAALVGDAAGYYDPFTGQGVYQAMAGAEALAAEVGPVLVAAVGPAAARDSGAVGVEVDAALVRYRRAHRRMTRPARRVQRLIEAVLSRPRLADAALGRLARATAVTDHLVEVTGDLRPPRALLSPRLLTSFLFPPTPETP